MGFGYRTITFVVLLAIPLFAASGPPEIGDVDARVTTWGAGLAMDPRVLDEVNSFERDGNRLPDGYAAALAADVRSAVFDAARGAIRRVAEGQIAPFVEVTYPEPGFARRSRPEANGKVSEAFEKGFIRTEGLAFFKNSGMSAGDAMHIYASEAFRMRISSRIKELWSDDNLSCIETTGVTGFLAPTRCCNRIDEFVVDNLAVEHSQVVSNGPSSDFQRIYFKESLKTFISYPGGMVVHYINYTRSVKLGRFKRAVGTGKIRESQERRFEGLRAVLDAPSE